MIYILVSKKNWVKGSYNTTGPLFDLVESFQKVNFTSFVFSYCTHQSPFFRNCHQPKVLKLPLPAHLCSSDWPSPNIGKLPERLILYTQPPMETSGNVLSVFKFATDAFSNLLATSDFFIESDVPDAHSVWETGLGPPRRQLTQVGPPPIQNQRLRFPDSSDAGEVKSSSVVTKTAPVVPLKSILRRMPSSSCGSDRSSSHFSIDKLQGDVRVTAKPKKPKHDEHPSQMSIILKGLIDSKRKTTSEMGSLRRNAVSFYATRWKGQRKRKREKRGVGIGPSSCGYQRKGKNWRPYRKCQLEDTTLDL